MDAWACALHHESGYLAKPPFEIVGNHPDTGDVKNSSERDGERERQSSNVDNTTENRNTGYESIISCCSTSNVESALLNKKSGKRSNQEQGAMSSLSF
jgi:hypothetical protein